MTDADTLQLAEIQRLQGDCSQLYQVIGVLARAAGCMGSAVVSKALDNALAAATGKPRPHDDLLPFVLPKRRDSGKTESDSAA